MTAPFDAFASAIAEIPDPDERRRLGDALGAARLVAAMADAGDRQCGSAFGAMPIGARSQG